MKLDQILGGFFAVFLRWVFMGFMGTIITRVF